MKHLGKVYKHGAFTSFARFPLKSDDLIGHLYDVLNTAEWLQSRDMRQEYGSLKSRACVNKADLLEKTSFISQLENRLSDAAAEKRVSIPLG
jgi:hypothetical protein